MYVNIDWNKKFKKIVFIVSILFFTIIVNDFIKTLSF